MWKSAEYIIRKAQLSDSLAIHEAHMRSIRELCSHDYTDLQINAWSGRAYNYEIRSNAILNDYVLVVEIKRLVVGYGHLKWWKEKDHCEVMALYLTREVKGKGAGHEMLSMMIEKSQELGFSKLHLCSTLTSKQFYLNHGFKIVNEEIMVTIGGVSIPAIGMEISFI
jgi:L-amino acid N-acyltransferase YncA